MNNRDNVIAKDPSIEVVLQGGPIDLPEEARIQRITADCPKVKIIHQGGHEHFERLPGPAAQDDEPGPIVFRWTMRTKIAE